MRICVVEGCNKSKNDNYYCGMHYQRMKRYGSLEPRVRVFKKTLKCTVESCQKFRHGNGLCFNHYMKFRKTGTLEPLIVRYADPKARAKERHKKWRTKNSIHFLAYQAARKKHVKTVTPKWVDMSHIRKIYRERPEGHHVDHIIPIRGSGVTGLHVPWNLQYLPKVENLRKGNKVTFHCEM